MTPRTQVFRFVTLFAMLALVVSGSGWMSAAEAAGYTISGQVTDAAGNPVPGVAVTAYSNSATGTVKIRKVRADRDLAGYYPVGLGAVENRITVDVDWGGKAPGKVRYVFNDAAPIDDSITSSRSSRAFRFDRLLRPGSNTLTIIAVSADGTASAPRAYQLTGWACGPKPTALAR